MTIRGIVRRHVYPEMALVVDFVLHPFDGPFWHERNAHDAEAIIPAYLGACWGNYGLHLPGAFTAWKDWQGQKRWSSDLAFTSIDRCTSIRTNRCAGSMYWLKGIDTGVMDESPVRCFIPPTGEWKSLSDWPPPEARWTRFYLHKDGILSEH